MSGLDSLETRVPRVPGIVRGVRDVLALGIALFGISGCQAQQQPWPLWEAYGKHFLDDQGRVIDHMAGDRTTSEGQAYGMFFALVDNDRPRFDKLLRWTEANLADGDLTLHLPGWDWGKTATGEWKLRDSNPASDADLWLSYTLMEAGRLWHEPRYEKLGHLVAQRIAREEVVLIPGVGTTLVPGPQGYHPDPDDWVVNPSYLPLPLTAYLARVEPAGPWPAVLDSVPAVLDGGQTHGFAMDWELAGNDGVHPAPPPKEPSAGTQEPQAGGSYDAIRVYLWLGMTDRETPHAREALGALGGMARYLKTNPVPPIEVDPQGAVVHPDAPAGFSAAVIPYLTALGLKAQAAAQRDRLVAVKDTATGLYGRQDDYYSQNLALFSTGFEEGRFHFERNGQLAVRWK